MLNFGFHLSIAGGISKAFSRAHDLEINTFQIFTRSSRSWNFKSLEEVEVAKFLDLKRRFEKNFGKIVVHMPYLPNLASIEEKNFKKSLNSFLVEIKRCDLLNVDFLVTHLGSHKGKGMVIGRKNVISMLDKALELESKVKIVLENSAGTKSSVGSNFEDISKIIEGTSDPSKLGVCFDTCHAFAAGYDLRTVKSVENTLDHFNQVVGLDRLDVIHCNDSKIPLNGESDRHEHIGLGKIGLNGFKALLSQKICTLIPIILETPIDEKRDDLANLEVVKSLI